MHHLHLFCFVYPLDFLKFSLRFITYVSCYSVIKSKWLPLLDERLKKMLQFHSFPLKLINQREDAFNYITCSHAGVPVLGCSGDATDGILNDVY
jgi:hypothetical protein